MIFVSILSVFVITGLSFAGHHYHGCSGMMMKDLSSMDTDNDGSLSMDEFTEPHMGKYRSWFNMLDTNDDGFLSQDEWNEFRKAHGFGEKLES